MQLKVGDTVRYLNSVGGGRVTRIEGQMAYVDEDGFETPVLARECVVVASGDSFYKKEVPPALRPKQTATAEPKAAPQPAMREPEPAPLPAVEETPEGEKLNLVIGFEPADIRRLSSTTFDASFVNDSNYWLYLTVATRRRDSDRWQLRFGGVIEPQMQEFLFELTVEDLPDIDRLSVQALPFKRPGEFTRKAPVDFEQRIDATKFARLHCFDVNPYFESKVIAVDIVRDDKTVGRAEPSHAEMLQAALTEKQKVDRRRPRTVEKRSVKPDLSVPLEVDLHSSELLYSTEGLSKSDILNYQVDTFRRVMDENLKYPGRTIIFIHGKGEGVLRAALMKELNNRYKGHDVSDASFREYGFGATKVVIRHTR